MSTFEAYFALGAISIAISSIGATLKVESKEASITTPTAVLTVFVPHRNIEPPSTFNAEPVWNMDEDDYELE